MTHPERFGKENGSICNMLTTGAVAKIFDLCTGTIRRWSDQGTLKSYRVGPRGARRFRREDVAVLYLEKAIDKYLKP